MTLDLVNGIVYDLDEQSYHAHPSLSSTGARRLLESPAKYHYGLTHAQEPKTAFDVGHAVHAKVLGVGLGVEVLDFDSYRTKAAQEARDAARDAGLVPMLSKDMEPVYAMAEAVLAHPVARDLFEQPGNAEVSIFGTDPHTGVDMRARFDYLPTFEAAEPIAVDLKTARNASPDGFARAAGDHRYDIQQEWYLRLYATVTGSTMPFKFAVVETEPPYLVGVYPLATEFADLGRAKVLDALETYAACIASGEWPGYPLNPDPLQPPTWLMFTEGVID